MTKKYFYVFDVLLLGFLFFALQHTLFVENSIIGYMLDVALVLRIGIPFLLYRNEKLAVWPILAFTILFGIQIYTNTFYNTILNMGKFLSIVFSTEPSVDSYPVLERPITEMVIIYLITSAVVIFVVCCWMAYKTKNILVPVLAFVMMALLLPTVSLGYNVYQGMEGARSMNYRYHTTIPCEYLFVFPTKMFSPFATCIKENRDSVVRSVEYGYVLE